MTHSIELAKDLLFELIQKDYPDIRQQKKILEGVIATANDHLDDIDAKLTPQRQERFNTAKYFMGFDRSTKHKVAILVQHEGKDVFEIDVLDMETYEIAENPDLDIGSDGIWRVHKQLLAFYNVDIDTADDPTLHQLFVSAGYLQQ